MILPAFNAMLSKGELSSLFNFTRLKLIPKKTDPTSISNWRPIALLSTIYKLVSGAIARRLNKATDFLCSSSQKAYSLLKNINECSVNVLDFISQANAGQLSNALLMIDFSKAFDTVTHSFLIDTLFFFGFGPNFCQMVRTILSGRVGGVIMKEGIGATFPFETGSGQGDPPSPLFFILGVELLIIRLRSTDGLVKENFDGTDVTVDQAGCEAYADDLNLLIKLDPDIVNKIVSIMEEFFNLSGLKCNISKCSIVPVGANPPETVEYIRANCGLKVETTFTLLGIFYDSKLEQLSENFNNIVTNSRNIISYWSKFHLSLAGHVNVL